MDENMVIPLADVLQMRLGLHQKDGEAARIVGLPWEVRKYALPFMKLVLRMEVKASFVDNAVSAVLVRVKGDLYLYTIFRRVADEIVVVVIDAEKLTMPVVMKAVDGVHPREARSQLANGIVGVYKRKQFDTAWRKSNVGDLDSRSTGASQPATGPTDPA